MTYYMKEHKHSPKYLELGWINSIFQNHDQICACNNVITHLLGAINHQNSKKILSRQEIKKIQCRLTGEETIDTETGDDDALTGGELEALFADNVFEEEEPTG